MGKLKLQHHQRRPNIVQYLVTVSKYGINGAGRTGDGTVECTMGSILAPSNPTDTHQSTEKKIDSFNPDLKLH